MPQPGQPAVPHPPPPPPPDAANVMTNWLWQQYAIANGEQFAAGATTDILPQGSDHQVAAGNMIVYQLNPDGTQTAFAHPVPLSSATSTATSATSGPDVLEPGEVRLPPPAPPSNGLASAQPSSNQHQTYSSVPAAAAVPLGFQFVPSGQWSVQDSASAATFSSTTDAEKQLLRGALVERVREIQRLTRELEQAYALIHQLKQHNEYLQRQWGQTVTSAVVVSATDSMATRT